MVLGCHTDVADAGLRCEILARIPRPVIYAASIASDGIDNEKSATGMAVYWRVELTKTGQFNRQRRSAAEVGK